MPIPGVEALKQLQEAIRRNGADVVPDGWYTTADYAREWNKAPQNVGEILRRAVDTGNAEMRLFRVSTASGIRPTKHYRLL